MESPPSTVGRAARPGLVASLAIISAVPMAAESALRLLVQLYLKELEASSFTISLSTSLAWLGILAGSVAWGTLADRSSRRTLLLVILGAGAAAIALCGLLLPATATLALVFARVALLTGAAPITMAVVSGSSSTGRRGRMLALLSSLRQVGFMFGYLVAGFVLTEVGFRWSFLLFAAVPLTALPVALRLPVSRGAAGVSRDRPWALLREGGLRSLYLGVILRQMGNTGAGALIFVYMAALEIPTALMGILTGFNPALQIVAMLVFGRIADAVGRRRVFVLGFSLSVVVMLLFALSRSAVGIGLAFAALGCAFPALYIGSTAYIGDLVPLERQGTMLGLFESSRGLGGVLGPLVAGALVPAVGYRAMFLCMAGLTVLGLLLVLCGRHTTDSAASGA